MTAAFVVSVTFEYTNNIKKHSKFFNIWAYLLFLYIFICYAYDYKWFVKNYSHLRISIFIVRSSTRFLLLKFFVVRKYTILLRLNTNIVRKYRFIVRKKIRLLRKLHFIFRYKRQLLRKSTFIFRKNRSVSTIQKRLLWMKNLLSDST